MLYHSSIIRANYNPGPMSIEQSGTLSAKTMINKIGMTTNPFIYGKNAALYHEFIKTFGTHLATFGRAGGAVKMWMFTKSSYIEENTLDTAKQQASIGLKEVIKITGGYNTTVDNKYITFKNNSRVAWR